MVPSLPLLSCESSVSVKKTLIEKKKKNYKINHSENVDKNENRSHRLDVHSPNSRHIVHIRSASVLSLYVLSNT